MTNLSNIVEILAKQAMGHQANPSSNSSQAQGGLGGILGSVLGQLGGGSTQNNQQGGLGGILGSVLGQLGGSNQQASPNMGAKGRSTGKTLLIAVLPIVLAWIQKQGGIQGALDKLKGQGLSSQVDDWVSTGPGDNASVQPQQVQSLFGDQEIEQVAAQTQAPKNDIYQAITQVLPEIIDSLTPSGEKTNKQEANDDIQNVLNMVSGFLKK